jgi:hypothetical protein
MINLDHKFCVLSSGVKFHKNEQLQDVFFHDSLLAESPHLEHIDIMKPWHLQALDPNHLN